MHKLIELVDPATLHDPDGITVHYPSEYAFVAAEYFGTEHSCFDVSLETLGAGPYIAHLTLVDRKTRQEQITIAIPNATAVAVISYRPSAVDIPPIDDPVLNTCLSLASSILRVSARLTPIPDI